jgi:hypothetical protein
MLSTSAGLIAGILATMSDVALHWIVSALFLVLALLGLLVCTYIMLRVWFAWVDSRQRRLRESEARRYSQWYCPNCQRPFGHIETWVYPAGGSHDHDDRGDPFRPHVAFSCPHCRFSNCFDSSGKPMCRRGIYFDPGEMERWEQMAPGLVCPHCGASYDGWSGIIWGRADPTVISGPLLKCSSCKAEAELLETPEGPRFVRVRTHPKGGPSNT